MTENKIKTYKMMALLSDIIILIFLNYQTAYFLLQLTKNITTNTFFTNPLNTTYIILGIIAYITLTYFIIKWSTITLLKDEKSVSNRSLFFAIYGGMQSWNIVAAITSLLTILYLSRTLNLPTPIPTILAILIAIIYIYAGYKIHKHLKNKILNE